MSKLDLNPFFFEGGPAGCLLIHGFSGSPPEMWPMGEYLAEKGLTVLGVRLAGHGTTPEDMARTTWRDWVASAEGRLQELMGHCNRVFVAGFSMGGLIALHLAAHHTVAGVVLWPNSGHAITVDSEREAVWARACEFIYRRLGELEGMEAG